MSIELDSMSGLETFEYFFVAESHVNFRFSNVIYLDLISARKAATALVIDNSYFNFQPVSDSANLYVCTPLLFLKPWKRVRLYFGRQCCFSGYLYYWDLHKSFRTEFGTLQVDVRWTYNIFPSLVYHFVLKASVVQ